MKHCKRKNHRPPDKSVKNNYQTFICHHCNSSFNIKHNLVHHIKQYHILNKEYKADKFHCALCNSALKKYSELLDHYATHNIKIKRETMKFLSDTQFYEWKREEESRSCNSYIKHFATKTSKEGVRRETYYCHRSGTFRSKSKGERKLKKQGSKKIGKHCPARMYVKFPLTGGVSVDYISTHVAHDIEISHLTLTGTERLALANKISMNVPYDDIIKEALDSADPSNLRRCNLLTKKDLNNIEKCFNLTSCRKQNETDNVENWVPDGNSRTSDGPVQHSEPIVQIQTERFVESKIKFINDLAQLVNDNVNSPEELEVAQKFLEPLLSELLAVRSPQTTSQLQLKAAIKPELETTNVLCLTSSMTEGSIQIIHAPTHIVSAPAHILNTQSQVQETQIIDLIPASIPISSTNEITQSSESDLHNITNDLNAQDSNNAPNEEQETLALPLINLESINHFLNNRWC